MLTSDLLMTRKRNGKIYPSYLKDKDKYNHLKIIKSMINIFETHIGLTYDELEESLKASYDPSINKKILDGFAKLLKNRCVLNVESDVPPEIIRKEIFIESANVWKSLDTRQIFDRNQVLKSVSEKLGISKEDIEEQMYADLKGSQIIKDFKPTTPISLYNRYNLSLAQAVLYKATKVDIYIENITTKQLRELFRYIKFFRLINTIYGNENNGYHIILDGPYSLFKSIQKYGLQMAFFLPALVLMEKWTLHADLLWGKSREKTIFEIDNTTGLISHYNAKNLDELEECGTFFEQFKEMDSEWEIKHSSEIINLKGEGICVPDFVFTNKNSKNKVFMEVFGYWSRDTVWKRIELLEKNFPHKLILAVSKKLRISEKAVKDNLPGQVYVYNTVILTKSILKILDEFEDSQHELFE